MSERVYVRVADEEVRLVKLLDENTLLYCYGKITSPTCYKIVLGRKPEVSKLPDEEARRLVQEEIRHMRTAAQRIEEDFERVLESIRKLVRDLLELGFRELEEIARRIRV